MHPEAMLVKRSVWYVAVAQNKTMDKMLTICTAQRPTTEDDDPFRPRRGMRPSVNRSTGCRLRQGASGDKGVQRLASAPAGVLIDLHPAF